MEKAKVSIELVCDDCDGQGQLLDHDADGAKCPIRGCPTCDSTGVHKIKVNLATLKHLLEGGHL